MILQLLTVCLPQRIYSLQYQNTVFTVSRLDLFLLLLLLLLHLYAIHCNYSFRVEAWPGSSNRPDEAIMSLLPIFYLPGCKLWAVTAPTVHPALASPHHSPYAAAASLSVLSLGHHSPAVLCSSCGSWFDWRLCAQSLLILSVGSSELPSHSRATQSVPSPCCSHAQFWLCSLTSLVSLAQASSSGRVQVSRSRSLQLLSHGGLFGDGSQSVCLLSN